MAGWIELANIFGMAAAAGLAFSALANVALRVAAWRPGKTAFEKELGPPPGVREQRARRALGREAVAISGGLLTLALTAVTLWLTEAGQPAWPRWLSGILFGGAVLLVGLAGWRLWQLLVARRRLAYAWAATTAVGNVLKRLNLAGFRIFHDVVVEGAHIDHVVLGSRGVFAVNVVPRRVRKGAKPAAELRNGKLVFGSETDALPVGEAARNMTLLSAALSRKAGHRVVVRSVIAVPGWSAVPSEGANHLLMNENNLVMLPSWNTPDAYLMDEDCALLQEFLIEASRNTRMD